MTLLDFFSAKKQSSILERIAAKVRERIEREKAILPEAALRSLNPEPRQALDFRAVFQHEGFPRVIAEIKFASPSEGDIAPEAEPLSVAEEYLSHGASALSVLTEPEFFKGSPDYLARIRAEYPEAYLLMKDFVVDPYQISKAWVFGADAVLLIVALLGKKYTRVFLQKAHDLGLCALVEVHSENDMATALEAGAELIGVNNRNLDTMDVDLKTSERLAGLAPKTVTLISESGIRSREDMERLRAFGYRGFLIGTHLMKSGAPGKALAKLLEESP